jgi:hypothetical protein
VKLELVPLLQVQRDLYDLPRGMDRFREYLRTMIDAKTQDLKLPLVAMNPMAKDHVAPYLDRLMELGAERAAADAVLACAARFSSEPGEFRVCLVVSDDARGGWTNRYTSELGYRFDQEAYTKRGWLPVILWTSETYTPESVREEVVLCIARAVHVARHGRARTLAERLDQEAFAMHAAGSTTPVLELDDLAYTRDVIGAHASSESVAIAIAALFGDTAARELGHPPLGLSPRAGLALALSMAHRTS